MPDTAVTWLFSISSWSQFSVAQFSGDGIGVVYASRKPSGLLFTMMGVSGMQAGMVDMAEVLWERMDSQS